MIDRKERQRINQARWLEKHRDDYNKRIREKRANDPEYRERKKQYQRDWRKKNATKQATYKRRSILKNTYGLTLEEHDALLKKQEGVCAICKISPAVCVDHCHKTGKVRGLLCHACNRSIGMLKDDINVLKSAINYLKKHV